MAKIRRLVRKAPPPAGRYFDEQLWPVYIALVVLGGFLMGVTAAYLPLVGAPWHRTAWPSLLGIPLVVAAAMIAFRLIDNRVVRRSLQLSLVLCAILHVALVVQMIETRIFAGIFERPSRERDVLERRPLKIVPEYHPSQLVPEEDRPRQDFEKPLPAQTPEPVQQTEQIVRQPQAEDRSPREPQPVPLPEQDRTTEPNVVARNRPNEVAPRLAANTSLLSRQLRPSESQQSRSIELPQAEPQPAIAAAASPNRTAASRPESSSAAQPRTAEEPAPASEAIAPQLVRRSDSPAPSPETSAMPTLPRAVAAPAATPRTQIATAETPSPARQTSPTELRPANTAAKRQATTSPQLAQRPVEPAPQARDTTEQPQRRQSPAVEQPAIATAPSPASNRLPRQTARPDVATAAAVANNTAAAPNTSAVEVTPRASLARRTAAEVTAATPANPPASEPQSSRREQAASRISRLEGQPAPAATDLPNVSPTLTRQTASVPSLPAVAQSADAPAATATASAAGELSPVSTATRRVATANSQAAPATGEPRAATVASNARPTPDAVPLARATSGSGAPNLPVAASAAPVPVPGRTTESAIANVVTRPADVPTNAGPQAAPSATVGPSSSALARQSAASGAAASQARAGAASAPEATNATAAIGSVTRAQVAAVPTLAPHADSGTAPRRAAQTAPAPTSTAAADSPAAALASSASADAAAQPSRVALSRSQSGTAGAGRSPNLDSSLPGGTSPALVASAAARRAEATQSAPEGDALSPSAPAQIARSRAGAELPSATVKAETLASATVAGGAQTAELSASTSAALTRADAAAKTGAVTAARGLGEVDLGPTQVVTEAGMGRASGGGQANPSFQTPAPALARQPSPGGAPQMSLAAAEAGPVAAPAGDSGGAPQAAEAAPTALTAARGSSGAEQGQLAQASAAAVLADAPQSRDEAATGRAGGDAAAGVPAIDDEEEKARRLARIVTGGAPQVAIAGPVLADVAASPMGVGGDGGVPATTGIAATQLATARVNQDGGAPAGGTPQSASAPDPGAAGGQLAAPLTVTRAEAADGAPGEPAAGGGTASPSRQAAGPSFAADTHAEQIALAGAPASGGAPDGSPLEARGLKAARQAGGATGPATTGPIGAAAGSQIVDAPRPAEAGAAPGRRQVAADAAGGPAIEGAAAAIGRRAAAMEAAGTAARAEVIPEVGPTSAVAQAEMDHHLGGAGQTPMSRQSGGEAIAADIRAPDGPGGLGADYTPEVGISARQARSDSMSVQLRSARFLRANVGGLPAVSATAIVASDAFSSRGARVRGDNPSGGRGAPAPQTEEAIERGLAFLARYRTPGGGWSLQGFPEGAQLVSDTAATALAVIAFQGAGYNHREFQYRDAVRGGIDFLVQSQKENGDLFVPLDDESNRSVWLYSHSLAAIALCEAYGMTHDPALREPAQKAIDFIVAGQESTRGGWRYSPGVGADTSVTGWMMMALKSGQLAGLDVPTATFVKIGRWLDSAQQSAAEPHLYRYNPDAPDTPQQRHGRAPSKTMTSVGLLMRLYTGWKRDNPHMIRGAQYLAERPPALGTARDPQRDTYYWYYATQVMAHMGGDEWQSWNARLHPLLVNSQLRQGPYAGSWDPQSPLPDRWGPHAGRLYVTAMNLLSLEVQYRKLPLYEETAK